MTFLIGKRVAMLRKEKGWTQIELAASISRGCVAAIEGGRDPGIKTVAMIADALGVEVRELYEGDAEVTK